MPPQKIDKMPTKLEQLQLQFRQKLMQEKEERMIRIHTDSQQKALSKVTRYDNNIPQVPAAVSVTKKPPTTYPSQPHQSPIKKGSPGVDRSRPLPPLQKEQKNHYNNRISPSSTPGETATKTVSSNGSRSRSVDLEIKNMSRPSVNGRLKQRTDSNHSLEADSYARADHERMATNVDYLAKLRQAELQRIRSNAKNFIINWYGPKGILASFRQGQRQQIPPPEALKIETQLEQSGILVLDFSVQVI